METITITIFKDAVYEEVSKATDYTGSKLIEDDAGARDRILASDDDLDALGRFWDESVMAANENFKEMLVSGQTKNVTFFSIAEFSSIAEESVEGTKPPAAIGDINVETRASRPAYVAVFEVSRSFDKTLTASVQTTLQSFFIASIIGQWFKFANKGESKDYFVQAAAMIESAERLLYSRRKPARPTD